MKTIKVQKDCVVDRKNIAKAKQREIALSVTSIDALNGNESGFINFTLGIEGCQLSLEFFGTYLLKEKKQDLFYVDRIELDVDLAEEELKNINKELQEKFSHGDVICAKVYDDREKAIATAIAFNHHSGYYAHSVEALENGKIIYEKELWKKVVDIKTKICYNIYR